MNKNTTLTVRIVNMFKQTTTNPNIINSNIKEMLSEYLEDIELEPIQINDELSKTQEKAFELFKKGKSLLILGPGGTGKSLLIKKMEEYINDRPDLDSFINIHVCATTGVAAYNIGGMTINSFMGIGTGEKDVNYLISKIIRNKNLVDRLLKTDILVIDEISMMSASLFEKINQIFKHFKKSRLFFGGVQVVLTGDLAQLCPVFNQNKFITHDNVQDTRLIVESELFKKTFKKNKNIILLKENFRQQNDLLFMNLLLRIRENKHTPEDIILLKNKCTQYLSEFKTFKKKGITPIHLVSSNKKAQIINEYNLKQLSEPTYTSTVKYKTSFITSDNKDTIELLKKELETQLNQKGLTELQLKKNTRVMLIKNLDVQTGLINGAIGTVVDFTFAKNPIILFDNGIKQTIEKHDWELEMNHNSVTATQFPLILAYAITLHKSQSLTLTNAILDLEDAFAAGMVYVGLSRLKSLDGLLLKSFNPSKIIINETIIDYLNSIS